MIHILVESPFEDRLNWAFIEPTAVAVLRQQGVDEASDLSVVIDGDAKLQELNLQYLSIDAPTDVLSFESDEIDPETELPYLGDIIISLPRAEAQATSAGHALQSELQLLIVHGVLHLLGYDHAEEDEKAEMWAAQSRVLGQLNVPIARYPD